jgi:hypothetical protein
VHDRAEIAGDLAAGLDLSDQEPIVHKRRDHLRWRARVHTRPSARGDPESYPESNMFGDLPASAYYLRHVDGVHFDSCRTTIANPDARQLLVTDDVTGRVGSP